MKKIVVLMKEAAENMLHYYSMVQFIPEGSRDAPAKRKHKLSLISSVSEV